MSYLFSLFYKSTIFLLILRVYTNKITFTVSNDVLLLSVRSKIMKHMFVIFAVIRKKMQVIVQVAVLILK